MYTTVTVCTSVIWTESIGDDIDPISADNFYLALTLV